MVNEACCEQVDYFARLKEQRPENWELLHRMAELQCAKGFDYGGKDSGALGNLLECEEIDVPCHIGIFVRMGDKWSRMRNFIKQGVLLVKDEKIEDTALDLAVYCLLFILGWRRKQKAEAPEEILRAPQTDPIEEMRKTSIIHLFREGYSDRQVADILQIPELEVRAVRQGKGVQGELMTQINRNIGSGARR